MTKIDGPRSGALRRAIRSPNGWGGTTADLADAKQADAFLVFLEVERRELVAEHAKLTRMGDTRRSILWLEGDIRHIDGMVDALQRRFSAGEVRRRA